VQFSYNLVLNSPQFKKTCRWVNFKLNWQLFCLTFYSAPSYSDVSFKVEDMQQLEIVISLIQP